LLSLVIGDTPGLEVFDRNLKRWFQIEKSYQSPAATLLVGRQLELLSNARYTPGGHLVRSYPNLPSKITAKTDSSRNYRYSIVLALRAHSPVPVNTDMLTNSITGEFQKPINGITAGDMFREIHQAHFNVNTSVEERQEQRERLAKEKLERLAREKSEPKALRIK